MAFLVALRVRVLVGLVAGFLHLQHELVEALVEASMLAWCCNPLRG